MSTRFEPGAEGLLLAILNDTAQLEGAACVGRADLFDPPQPEEDRRDTDSRHVKARQVCMACPALNACHEWAQRQKRFDGVLAGSLPLETAAERITA